MADPDRVVRLERWFENRNVGTVQYIFSYPEYLYLRNRNSIFADMVAGSDNLGLVVVISDAYWQRRFRRDPAVLDRVVEIDGTRFTIVGVAARGFMSTAVDDPFTQF